MLTAISALSLAADSDWDQLRDSLSPASNNPLLAALLSRLRMAGVLGCVIEGSYIDRDFSAAFSAFYSTLFRPYQKFCSRLHFFTKDVGYLRSITDPLTLCTAVKEHQQSYAGFIVLRPLTHAPVSIALFTAEKLNPEPQQEITVRSHHQVHVLGATLDVTGFPLTQQDTRVGACAQASIWMVGRHFHDRHGGPWVSMPDITANALKPTDSAITRSLPAGSDYLTPDNMVRALRAMGQHPVFYAPYLDEGKSIWGFQPVDVISRYVDSGIPVIIGFKAGRAAVGHAVVAIGLERRPLEDKLDRTDRPSLGALVSHFLVNDDQRGAYCRLRVSASDEATDYDFCLETDLGFFVVPLPNKVFMTGEVAEEISWDLMVQVCEQRRDIAATVLHGALDNGWDPAPAFHEAAQSGRLVARTYLTFGWRYKARALQNDISEQLKRELLARDFPRYVWVTEFSVPEEAADLDPCRRRVRAHVVNDATGSRFWDSTLLLDTPGLLFLWSYDPKSPSDLPEQKVHVLPADAVYFPKIRGTDNFAACALPG